MPDTTPIFGFPFPEDTDPTDVPGDLEALALAVEADLDNVSDTQTAALAAHLADPTAAHAASAVSFTPAGNIAATTVQAAIAELDTETDARLDSLEAKRSWSAVAPGADQSGISAVTDITGLSVTWTAVSTRQYKTTLNVTVNKAVSANFVGVAITDQANNTKMLRSSYLNLTDMTVVEVVVIETGLSGSQTRKGRADATGGTAGIVNGFSRNGILIVEDIGPA